MDSVLGGQVRLVTHLVIMMEMIQMEMILGRVVVHHSSTYCLAHADSSLQSHDGITMEMKMAKRKLEI